MFNRKKDSLLAAESEQLIEYLLQDQSEKGVFDLDPAYTARKLVTSIILLPKEYKGRFGQAPKKVMFAAVAFSKAIDSFLKHNSMPPKAFATCLANILLEMNDNPAQYLLNTTEKKLYKECSDTLVAYAEFAGAKDATASGSDFKSKNLSWEEWYQAYKKEAAKHNPELRINIEGRSLIDWMDHEPVKRAYLDGIDPCYFAREVAKEFKFREFGQVREFLKEKKKKI